MLCSGRDEWNNVVSVVECQIESPEWGTCDTGFNDCSKVKEFENHANYYKYHCIGSLITVLSPGPLFVFDQDRDSRHVGLPEQLTYDIRGYRDSGQLKI